MFLNHAINQSATIVGKAAAKLENPNLLAVKVDANGAFALPAAGDPCIGIVLADSDTIEAGDDVHVQIKDIGYWMGGGVIAAGSELATDAAGKAVVAESGAFIVAIALEDGAKDKPVSVQIVKAGYKSGGSITPVTLAGLADVDLTSAADGDLLVYDGTAKKWKNSGLNLADLGDVTITEPTAADTLNYDGDTSKWVNGQ